MNLKIWTPIWTMNMTSVIIRIFIRWFRSGWEGVIIIFQHENDDEQNRQGYK